MQRKSSLRRIAAMLAASLLVVLSLGMVARAADGPGDKTSLAETSLGLVPDDAAFFAVQLRMREQLDALAGSRLVGRIAEMAGLPHATIDSTQKWIDLALAQVAANAEDDPSAADFREWLKQDENKELLDTVVDALSNEAFVYGGGEYAKWAEAYGEFDRRTWVELRRAVEERGEELDLSEGNFYEQIDLDRAIPWEQISSLELPATVIGFRVSDAARARRQVARLKPLLPLIALQAPQLAGHVKVVKVGDDELISIDLDGSLVDWEALREQELENAEEEGREISPQIKAISKRLVEILKTKKLNVSFGILNDYLLVSVAADREHLESLGKGKTLLDQPDLAGMLKHTRQGKLVAASYTANRLMRAGGDPKLTLDGYVTLAEAWLDQTDEIDAMMKLRLKRDARELADDVKRFLPEPGGKARVVLWTDRGYEGWLQSWQENLTYDATQPLTITQHADGDPLVLLASRSRYAPEDYALLVKWIKKGEGYLNDFGLEDEEDRVNYTRFRKEAGPFFARADKLIGEMLIPALRDGQKALVIDAKLKSKIHPLVPTERPLPVLQMALVWGVSDAALLKQSFREGAELVNSIAAKLHEIEPEEVPEWTFPAPEVMETGEGAFYSYAIPPEAGLDAQFAPTAAVSNKVAVAAFSHDQAKRLLKSKPLAVEGPIAQHKGAAAAVAYVDFAGLLEAIRPWGELAIRHGGDIELPDIDDLPGAFEPFSGEPFPGEGFDDDVDSSAESAPEEETTAEEVAEAVPAEGEGVKEPAYDVEQAIGYFRGGLDFLKCFRGYSSVTYAEQDSLVTHFEWRIEDLSLPSNQ